MKQLALAPFETGAAILGAQQLQVAATRLRGRAGGEQGRVFIGGAVAIRAIDFHRRRHFAVDVAIAMRILREMAVDAGHALVEVNRGEMHGLVEFFRVGIGHGLICFVEQGALAITLEHLAEIPAVAVIIGELRVLQCGVERGNILQKILVTPQAAGGGLFRIAIENLARFLGRRVFLFFRPHARCIGLVIPHGGAVKRIHEHIRLVHMADHALR